MLPRCSADQRSLLENGRARITGIAIFPRSRGLCQLIEPNRASGWPRSLACVDAPRFAGYGLELKATTDRPVLCRQGPQLRDSWPVAGLLAFGDVRGEGLLLIPTAAGRSGGRRGGDSRLQQHARTTRGLSGTGRAGRESVRSAVGRERLSRDRADADQSDRRHRPDPQKQASSGRLSNREWAYRQAYEMGGTLIGYEVAKGVGRQSIGSAACADRASRNQNWAHRLGRRRVVGPVRRGALGRSNFWQFARAATSTTRNDLLWQQPIDRNVFGLLEQFGDAELASLIALRKLDRRSGQGAGSGDCPPAVRGARRDESLRRNWLASSAKVEPGGASWSPRLDRGRRADAGGQHADRERR